MSKLSTLTPIAAVLAVSVAGMAHAAENPFALKPATGIVVADAGKEGSCGGKKAEGSCGAKKSEGSCGASKEAKCGADKKAQAESPAPASADKTKKESKFGEGKCGNKGKSD